MNLPNFISALIATILVNGAAMAQAATATCDRPAFMVAFDTIDTPPGGVAPSTGIGNAMADTVRNGQSELVLSGLPDLTYEKSTEWQEVAITRWSCADALTSAWPSIAANVKTPAATPNRIFAVGVFDPSPIDDGGVEADLMPDNCASPILLIGLNTVTDPAKYAVYREALSASKLPFRHGFRRIFAGAPKTVLAGQWPKDTTVTLSVWPCRAAFEKFHKSDRYQKAIYPLRVGNSRYRLVAYAFGRHKWPLINPK